MPPVMPRFIASLAVASAVGLVACTPSDIAQRADSTTGRPPVTAASSTWSDSHVLGFAAASFTALANGADAVVHTSRTRQMRQFWERMGTEHRALAARSDSVTRRLGLVAERPPGLEFLDQFERTMRDLGSSPPTATSAPRPGAGSQKKPGTADGASRPAARQVLEARQLDATIEFHERLIDKLDEALAVARHPEVRRLLEGARPRAEAHIAEARRLRGPSPK